MPDSYFTFDYDSTSSSPDLSGWVTFSTAAQVQQQYEEYRQEQERQQSLIQQFWDEHQQMCDEQARQAEELRKDKVKYPLFFLKEGIV